VIADSIIAMEGDGPLNGRATKVGQIVLSDDLVTADAIGARVLHVIPEQVAHIREASFFLGRTDGYEIL
jgi:uncharacterized protein (DUF362 family)